MLDHIGGINTLFHILTSGGTVVTLPERTPEAICAGIERHRVQLLPTTPTFLRMLLDFRGVQKIRPQLARTDHLRHRADADGHARNRCTPPFPVCG